MYLNPPKVGKILAQDSEKAIILYTVGVHVGFRVFCWVRLGIEGFRG